MRKFLIIFLIMLISVILLRFENVYNASFSFLGKYYFDNKNFGKASEILEKININSKNLKPEDKNIIVFDRIISKFYNDIGTLSEVFRDLDKDSISNKKIELLDKFFKANNRELNSLFIGSDYSVMKPFLDVFLGFRYEFEGYKKYIELKNGNKNLALCSDIEKNWKESVNKYSDTISSKDSFDKKMLAIHLDILNKKIIGLGDLCKNEDEKKDEKKDDSKTSKDKDQKGDKGNTGTGSKEEDKTTSETDKSANAAGKNFTNKGQFNELGKNSNAEGKYENESEKKQIEEYSESLKQFQKSNSEYLRKGSVGSRQDNINSILNNFSQDPLFRDMAPLDSGIKDW